MWWSQRIMDQVESYSQWRRQYFLNPQFLTEKLLAFLLACWQAPPLPCKSHVGISSREGNRLGPGRCHSVPFLFPPPAWGRASCLAYFQEGTGGQLSPRLWSVSAQPSVIWGWARPSFKKRWHLQFHAQSSFSWVPTLCRVLWGFRMNKTRLPTWREPQSRRGDNTCR